MNRLIHEKSLYLLQHALNPVDWYSWGDEAFEVARKENKLVLISIGYSSCHWCHVMEKECFENTEIASLMNQFFVNIKVDREEHPEVDEYYMSVLQAMNGFGGWPLNMFATAEGLPIYGGTYFPPTSQSQQVPSWPNVLMHVYKSWQENPNEIVQQAEKIRTFFYNTQERESIIYDNNLSSEMVIEALLEKADFNTGGFGSSPKFPMWLPFSLLIQEAVFSENEKAIHFCKYTLNQILLKGMYDQTEGGLMRYSTDQNWVVPHFEKMLYDQAFLLPLLAKMYHHFQDEKYLDYFNLQINFITIEMMNEQHLFYASIDADSQDGEGVYYSYSLKELRKEFENDWIYLNKVFNLSSTHTFENRQLLVYRNYEKLPENIRIRLKKIRHQYLKPKTDTKLINSWNVLTILGFIESYFYTLDENLINFIQKSVTSFFNHFMTTSKLRRVHYSEDKNIDATLEDYAFTLKLTLRLYLLFDEENYLTLAEDLYLQIKNTFLKEDVFRTQTKHQISNNQLLSQDQLLPSPNAIMFENLILLGLITKSMNYIQTANILISKVNIDFHSEMFFHSYWATSLVNQKLEDRTIVEMSSWVYKKHLQIITKAFPRAVFRLRRKHDFYFQVCTMQMCQLNFIEENKFLEYIQNQNK